MFQPVALGRHAPPWVRTN